jgi:hypothetical protein
MNFVEPGSGLPTISLLRAGTALSAEPERGGFTIGVPLPGRGVRHYPLLDVGRDEGGSDLGTARIFSEPNVALPPCELTVAPEGFDAGTGTDVWTYGYPLTDTFLDPESDEDPRFRLNPRLLRGYITREFAYDHEVLGPTPSYELDMVTPEGLSGAPLFRRPGEIVIGVIYGRHEVELVDQFASVDPTTGEHKPEVQRIVSFGLACDMTSFRALRGPATGGVTLARHLGL